MQRRACRVEREFETMLHEEAMKGLEMVKPGRKDMVGLVSSFKHRRAGLWKKHMSPSEGSKEVEAVFGLGFQVLRSSRKGDFNSL